MLLPSPRPAALVRAKSKGDKDIDVDITTWVDLLTQFQTHSLRIFNLRKYLYAREEFYFYTPLIIQHIFCEVFSATCQGIMEGLFGAKDRKALEPPNFLVTFGTSKF
jgi:hypothetical protein